MALSLKTESARAMSPISSARFSPEIEVSSAPSARRRMAAVIWPIGPLSVMTSAAPAAMAIRMPSTMAPTEIVLACWRSAPALCFWVSANCDQQVPGAVDLLGGGGEFRILAGR